MKRIFISMAFGLMAMQGSAQYFQFSQYNFTPQRINPALVASSDNAVLNFVYRNQATGGGFHINSNILSASYPLITRNGIRWSGIGVSFMDDRSGEAGIYDLQEAAVSYALNIFLTRRQTISLGVKALHQTRRINLEGLYTGSQYVTDRGFDESVSNGEGIDRVKNNFTSFSAGLYWQQTDKKGNKLAYWSISFFDFNKPQDSFLGSSGELNDTFVGSGGIRLYRRGNVSIMPEVLLTRGASNTVLNGGLITRYEIRSLPNRVTAQLDLITKYVVGRSGIFGLQLHRDHFSIGMSYDFPVVKRNLANTGTVELGLELRHLVDRKKKDKTTARRKAPVNSSGKPKATVVKEKQDTIKSPASAIGKISRPAEDISTRLRQKQDSISMQAMAGEVSHEPLILEKATLHFNFEFNSSVLNKEAQAYFDDLATALLDNPRLRISLEGHTDNVGSDRFNLKLSYYRAQSIKEYLILKGVKEERIVADGKGMQEPLNENKTEEDRAQNRRVELTILYEE